MKETYLSRDFRETAAQCFPSQAKELNAFFDARLNVLLAENADIRYNHHHPHSRWFIVSHISISPFGETPMHSTG